MFEHRAAPCSSRAGAQLAFSSPIDATGWAVMVRGYASTVGIASHFIETPGKNDVLSGGNKKTPLGVKWDSSVGLFGIGASHTSTTSGIVVLTHWER
jgi:hypothetical protein